MEVVKGKRVEKQEKNRTPPPLFTFQFDRRLQVWSKKIEHSPVSGHREWSAETSSKMPQQSSEINCRIECQSKAVNSTRGALYRPRFCLTALHRAWVGQREEERERDRGRDIWTKRDRDRGQVLLFIHSAGDSFINWTHYLVSPDC